MTLGKRGGVRASNYVLHIGKSCTVVQKRDCYYLVATKVPLMEKPGAVV